MTQDYEGLLQLLELDRISLMLQLVVVVKPLDVVNEIKIDDSFPSIASVMAYLIASDFPVD